MQSANISHSMQHRLLFKIVYVCKNSPGVGSRVLSSLQSITLSKVFYEQNAETATKLRKKTGTAPEISSGRWPAYWMKHWTDNWITFPSEPLCKCFKQMSYSQKEKLSCCFFVLFFVSPEKLRKCSSGRYFRMLTTICIPSMVFCCVGLSRVLEFVFCRV